MLFPINTSLVQHHWPVYTRPIRFSLNRFIESIQFGRGTYSPSSLIIQRSLWQSNILNMRGRNSCLKCCEIYGWVMVELPWFSYRPQCTESASMYSSLIGVHWGTANQRAVHWGRFRTLRPIPYIEADSLTFDRNSTSDRNLSDVLKTSFH